MAFTFSADFATHQGVSLCDVRAPMTLTFTRNAAPRVDHRLDLEEEASALLTAALQDGLPRARVWVRQTVGADGDLVINAPWAPMREAGAGDTGTLDVSFRGPLALLERRFTAAVLTFTGQDAGQIAWDLIDETNTADGFTGIVEGAIETTVARDRTYEHKQRAEAIVQLTDVQGGFDFEIAPVDEGTTIGEFNVYASQGVDRSGGLDAVVFEYGPGTVGNVLACERETQSPVNWVRALGANGLIAEASDSTSVAKYGVFGDVLQVTDVIESATLQTKADAALRPDPIRVVSFQPDPELAPQPWRDYWLGDTVKFRASHGSLDLDINVRVNGIALQIDEDGNVSSTTLTIDQNT